MITLSKAEAVALHSILQNLSFELSHLIGQDMTVELDYYDAAVIGASADEFNFDDVEVVDENGNYNMFSMVNHFLERIETECEGFT